LCANLCEHAHGIGSESCATECAIHFDTHEEERREAIRRYVQSRATNKKGGERMEHYAEDDLGVNIADCKPTVDIEQKPKFEEVDGPDQDGAIDVDEAIAYGEKACIPSEMMEQLFSECDLNQDKVISKDDPAEWSKCGEDTHMESEMDEAFEEKTQGDDEVNTHDLPDFDTWDTHPKDGRLSEREIEQILLWQISKKMPDAPDAFKEEIMKELPEMIAEVDRNGDGYIDRSEYEEATKNDAGDELREQAVANEDLPEPDGTQPLEDRVQEAEILDPESVESEGTLGTDLIEKRGKLRRKAVQTEEQAEAKQAKHVASLSKQFANAQNAEALFLRRFRSRSLVSN